jgi:DNA replication protein DnaC
MDISNIDKEIQQEFTEKRIRAEEIAQQNRALANSKPAFAKLVALEKDLIFAVAKNEANGEKSGDLKKLLKQTREKKKTYLKSLGLTEADLLPKYECEKCKDTGFIGTIVCDCFIKTKNAKIIKSAGFDADKCVSFDKFNTSVAKNETQAKILEKLKINLLKWCEKYPNTPKKTIILSGKTGVGKTFASKCVASTLASNGNSVCFVSAFQMNEIFLKYHTTFDANKSAVLTPLTECDALFIDDLGTEPILSNVTINYLYLILSERERFDRATIITTNLSPESILNQYGERVYSRLFNKRSSIRFEINGDDLRI